MKKQDIKAYLLIGGIALSNLVAAAGLRGIIKERTQLDKSDYVVKHSLGQLSVYAYDDNRDGNVDRIEEIGAAGKCPGPVFLIRRTYSENDIEFSSKLF